MAFILEADQLTKYFGATGIFDQVRLALEDGEKAGLVGANGAGKTTLLNCLAGREPVEGGFVRLKPYASIGFLEQTLEMAPEDTLLSSIMAVFADVFEQRKRLADLEAAMSQVQGEELQRILSRYGNEREQYERSGGFACESQVRRVLIGLGFTEEQFNRNFTSFSGGEKTRIGLARILVREHPLLFLDEPTNHLDLTSVEWLEGYLKTYPGALLIISHDRYFLDKVTETTFDLENGRLKRYKGGYSRYALQKEEETKAQARAYDKQQKEIQETEAYIRRFKAGIKSKQARGRQTRLDRLARLEKPGQLSVMNMGPAGIDGRTGEKVLVLDQLSYSYPGKQLFVQLNAEIRYGERVALLGPNGAGKTTILRLIMGQLKPEKGGVYLGSGVKPAYFDQEHQNLNSSNTVFQEILNQYDLTVEETKAYLARFLFTAEEWDKEINKLSGGEQGRLSLLKLTLEKGNFLILDEPTNHLDIQSREVMEEYLADYPGTLLMVSHDRYFLDALAERVLELTPEGLVSYPGNYSDYREWKDRKEREERRTKEQKSSSEQTFSQKNNSPGSPKNNQNKSLDRYAKARLRQRLQELEKEISELESEEAATTAALSNPDTYNDSDANTLVSQLNQRLQAIQERLPAAYQEWEEAGSQLEEA
ncbi:MAG: ABC-F family ATP-binding cassette domain-containing protein [Clostridiales bacterium]